MKTARAISLCDVTQDCSDARGCRGLLVRQAPGDQGRRDGHQHHTAFHCSRRPKETLNFSIERAYTPQAIKTRRCELQCAKERSMGRPGPQRVDRRALKILWCVD